MIFVMSSLDWGLTKILLLRVCKKCHSFRFWPKTKLTNYHFGAIFVLNFQKERMYVH